MTKATLEVPNAILFLLDDSDADVQIPTYIPSKLVSNNLKCISIGTRASVDGEVSILLEKHLLDETTASLARVFVGTIYAQSRLVSLVTSDARTILEMPIEHDTATVEIWADDERSPATIAIGVY